MLYSKIKRYFSINFIKYIFVRFSIIRKLDKVYRRYFKKKNKLVKQVSNHIILNSTEKEILIDLERYGFSKKISLDKNINNYILEKYKNSRFFYKKRHGDENFFFNYSSLKNYLDNGGEEIAYFTLKNKEFESLFNEISTSKLILQIIEKYLGNINDVDIRLNYSPVCNLDNKSRESYNQTVSWHYDVHALNFVYVFFYINGADKYSGAHQLIKGSHKKKLFFKHLLGSVIQKNSELEKFYNKDDFITIEGSEGNGFIEDTSCFHRALAPVSNSRLCLQLRYH